MKSTTNAQRRNFMLTLGLGVAAGAAALASGKPAHAVEAATAPEAAPQQRGYRLSEHVQTYYRSTRI